MDTIQAMVNQVCDVYEVCPTMANVLSLFYFGEEVASV